MRDAVFEPDRQPTGTVDMTTGIRPAADAKGVPTGPTGARPTRHSPRLKVVVALIGVAIGALVGTTVGSPSDPDGSAHTQPQSLRSSSPGGAPADTCSTPTNDMAVEVPWAQRRLGAARVWELTTGRGVVVGVIDTGVDATVPQLAGRVLPGTDIVNGQSRADSDCFGHGTFVAGIIGAQPRAGTGMAGLAPGATILPVRQANSSSDGTASGLARSIRAAVDGGAKVINMSASAFFPNDELRAAVQYAAAKDVVMVTSASNEAKAGNPVAYPAAYPEVIAVGSIGPDGKRSDFSEVGHFLDLVAPGVGIVSLSRAGQGHVTDNGTSYAAPFVAATAALVRSYHPELNAAQVRRRLERTADHPATTLPDLQVGWGVVNPYNAVSMVLPDEHGAGTDSGGAAPMSAVTWTPPDTRARDTATTFALALAAAAVLVAVLAYLLPKGVRRRWRPAADRGVDGAARSVAPRPVGRPTWE
jgi:membrane-anchored mycosin MYCP